MSQRTRTTKNLTSMIGLVFAFCASLSGQSSLHCLEAGSWVPVFEVKGGNPYCFTGDGLLKSSDERLTMLASPSFAEGFLTVEVVENIRSGVSSDEGALKFTSERGWFQFTAKVTSSEDIEDAYFIMRYNKLGESVYTCKSIGEMRAGKAKTIAIFKKVGYEMPEQLHFYSGMEEIRTNLVPSRYSYEYGDFKLEELRPSGSVGLIAAAE